MVLVVGLELTTYRLPSHFDFRRRATHAARSWSGLYLHHKPKPLGANRLVSTRSQISLGFARY